MTLREEAEEIRAALKLELASIPKRISYPIKNAQLEANFVRVTVDYDDPNAPGLDENIEGALASWESQPAGIANVLCVAPDRDEIDLKEAIPGAPPVGDRLHVYPPQFLTRLAEWWDDEDNAFEAVEWLRRARNENRFDDRECAPQPPESKFRIAQREAHWLTGWDFSLLEGPPGTGKTFTVGAIVAGYLAAHPDRRVLLLSSTNSAVDFGLVAVDKALERIPGSMEIRRACKRFGQQFRASDYAGREHLLPEADGDLVQELMQLERRRPDSGDMAVFAEWKNAEQAIRRKFRPQAAALIRGCRLAAMTACAGIYWMPLLQTRPIADLVVFDEASQVSLPYAAALATLGRRALFAGDPAQLAPIVRSEEASAILGKTAFDIDTDARKNRVFLNEQSRMHPEIGSLVSEVFYDGRLRVAHDAMEDPVWRRQRELASFPRALAKNVSIHRVRRFSAYSPQYRGPTRLESAEKIANVANALGKENPILVLTPFRAQRALLRDSLKNFPHVTVSTVHKAQGSECHTVIFDPVDANHFFLSRPDAARLINVALSRAQARLIMMASDEDERHPVFSAIVRHLRKNDGCGNGR